MKKISFLVIVIFLLGNSLSLSAQSNQTGRYADINYDKVEYVAETKTDQLDQVVQLEQKKQKKKVYQIYRSHEIKKQKKLRDAKFIKNHRYKRRPNHVQVIHTAYDERKENQLLEKLDKEAEQKVRQTLTNKQKQLLSKEHKKESAVTEQ